MLEAYVSTLCTAFILLTNRSIRQSINQSMFRPHTVHANPWIHNEKTRWKVLICGFAVRKRIRWQKQIIYIYSIYTYSYEIWHLTHDTWQTRKNMYIYTYMTNTYTHIYINGWSYLILSNLHLGICFLASPPANPWGFAQFFKFGWPADLWWHVLLVGAEILHILLALHRGCLGRWLEKIMISRLETYQKKCSSS